MARPPATLRALAVARGDEPADLLLRGGRVFVPHTRERVATDLAIADGIVAGLGAARAHEVASVFGVEGVAALVAAAAGLPFTLGVCVSSCVPESPFASAGAELGADDMTVLLAHHGAIGVAEVMNLPAVISGAPELRAYRGHAGCDMAPPSPGVGEHRAAVPGRRRRRAGRRALASSQASSGSTDFGGIQPWVFAIVYLSFAGQEPHWPSPSPVTSGTGGAGCSAGGRARSSRGGQPRCGRGRSTTWPG